MLMALKSFNMEASQRQHLMCLPKPFSVHLTISYISVKKKKKKDYCEFCFIYLIVCQILGEWS